MVYPQIAVLRGRKKTNKYRTHSQTIYIVGAFWTNPDCHSSGVSVVGSGGSLSPEHLAQSLGPGSGASSHGFVMLCMKAPHGAPVHPPDFFS